MRSKVINMPKFIALYDALGMRRARSGSARHWRGSEAKRTPKQPGPLKNFD
jgi:hypothetical protein